MSGLLSLLFVVTLTSGVWTALGEGDGSESASLEDHMFLFFLLGIICFIPWLLAVDWFGAQIAAAGLAEANPFFSGACGAGTDGQCVIEGLGALAYFGGGIMMYWASYIAGIKCNAIISD